jgi:hypothetical protein
MLATEDGFEEQRSSKFARLADLSSRDCSEVCHIRENVQDEYYNQSNRSDPLQ